MPGVGAMVLLLHELPDGSSHFDWMIEREGDGVRTLVTFRVFTRIDLLDGGSFLAERIGDHRVLYLTYEGPVGAKGEWGTVRRIAAGRAAIEVDGRGGEGMFRARGGFDRSGMAFIYSGFELGSGTWGFAIDAHPGAGPGLGF